MKAVVLELKGDKAAVLAPDGAVNFIKNNNYQVGQLLDEDVMPAGNKIITFATKHSRYIAAAACAAIIAGSLTTANTYAYSRVTLDVNPSVEYTLNVFDRVIDMKAYNDDGAVIAEELEKSIHGKKFEAALESTLDLLEDDKYIEGDTDAVITVDSSSKRAAALEEKAEAKVSAWNEGRKDEGKKDRVELEIVELTPELEEEAAKNNITPGRVYMIEKAAEEDLSVESAPADDSGNVTVTEPSEKTEDKGSDIPSQKIDEKPDSKPDEKPGEKPDNKPDEGNNVHSDIDSGAGSAPKDNGNTPPADSGQESSGQGAGSQQPPADTGMSENPQPAPADGSAPVTPDPGSSVPSDPGSITPPDMGISAPTDSGSSAPSDMGGQPPSDGGGNAPSESIQSSQPPSAPSDGGGQGGPGGPGGPGH